MFKIEFKIDTEDGIDATEILGDIKLYSDNGFIIEECTYIDSWIAALIQSITELNNSNFFNGDLIEEPDLLYFRKKKNNKIEVKYKSTILTVNSVQEIIEAIKEAANEITNIYKGDENYNENSFLKDFSNFVI